MFAFRFSATSSLPDHWPVSFVPGATSSRRRNRYFDQKPRALRSSFTSSLVVVARRHIPVRAAAVASAMQFLGGLYRRRPNKHGLFAPVGRRTFNLLLRIRSVARSRRR